MSDIQNCYTCGHCLDRDSHNYMKCALNGGKYCEIIFSYSPSRCSWVPREPTLWELITNKLKQLLS